MLKGDVIIDTLPRRFRPTKYGPDLAVFLGGSFRAYATRLLTLACCDISFCLFHPWHFPVQGSLPHQAVIMYMASRYFFNQTNASRFCNA